MGGLEARIYKDGRKIETVKSIPLYSVINGFWINETGNLEIVIRHTWALKIEKEFRKILKRC